MNHVIQIIIIIIFFFYGIIQQTNYSDRNSSLATNKMRNTVH